MSISFACGNCGKAYKVDDKFAGKKAACKACGTINLIPSASKSSGARVATSGSSKPAARSSAKASAPPPIPVARDDFDFDALERAATEADGLSEGAPPPVPGRRGTSSASACPGCGGPLDPGAIFCTGCGYNLRTGKQIATKVLAPEKPQIEMVAAPKRSGSAASTGGGFAGGGEAPGFAIWMIIIGAGSGILPVFGLQWKILAPLGPYAPIVGAVVAGIGALVCLLKGSMTWMAVGGGATVLSTVLFLTVGMNMRGEEDEDDSGKSSLVSSKTRNGSANQHSGGSSGSSGNDNAAPSGDFYWEGQPKIKARATGTALFSMVSYEAIRLPQGQDPIEFYKPALSQDNADVRLAAIDIINKSAGSSRGAEVAAAVAQCIDDSNPAVRGEALVLQGKVKNEQTVANVNKRIGDENPEIRKQAIRIALQFRDPSSVEPLLARLDDDPSIQSSLMTFSPEAREIIQKRLAEKMTGDLTSPNAAARRRAVAGVMSANPDACGEQIIGLFDDPDTGIRSMVRSKLASLKFEPAIEKFAAHLDDPTAAAALAGYGAAAESAILPKATEGEPRSRAGAIRLLAKINPAKALELAKGAARDPDLQLSAAGRAVWKELAPDEVTPSDFAMLDLEAEDEKTRLRGLHALKDLKPDKHKAAVAKRLYDLYMEVDGVVPTVAREALFVWADPLTRDALLQQITPDTDDKKRLRAVELMRQFKDARMIGPAVSCLAAGKGGGVADALKEFGPASEDELIKILRNENIFIVKEVCDILKEIGTKKSLQPLGLIALDQRSGARDAARDAAATINKRISGKR